MRAAEAVTGLTILRAAAFPHPAAAPREPDILLWGKEYQNIRRQQAEYRRPAAPSRWPPWPHAGTRLAAPHRWRTRNEETATPGAFRERGGKNQGGQDTLTLQGVPSCPKTRHYPPVRPAPRRQALRTPVACEPS